MQESKENIINEEKNSVATANVIKKDEIPFNEEQKEMTVHEVVVPKFIQEISDEEQRERIEGSTTILRRMETKVDKVLGNLDTGASVAGTSLFVLAGSRFEAGDIVNGIIYLIVAIIISLAKNRLPEGAITKLLRKPIKIVDNVMLTLTHKRSR